MKYNVLLLAFFLFINFSCAQDIKPLDEENDSSILIEETNYEMELVFKDENIIWSIEFINENSILAAVKSGSIFKYNDGVKTEIKGVPEIYLRDSFSFIKELIKVDLPTLGLPIIDTNPDLCLLLVISAKITT